MDIFASDFFRYDYMPHGHCYLWKPSILLTHVVSDVLIFLAYLSIPFALIIFINKRKDIGFESVFWLFSLFIVFCGVTHLVGIWTIWQGIYGVHGLFKAATAIVSVTTAAYCFKLLPQGLAIPSVQEYKGVQEKLHETVEERNRLTTELEHHSLFNFALNALPVSTCLLDEKGIVKLVNAQFNSEFLISEFEVNQTSIFDFVVCDNGDFRREIERGVTAQELTHHKFFCHIRTEQELVPAELILTKKVLDGRHVILATLSNRSEFILIKDELLQSHTRLERAINATEDGIWEWKIQEEALYWSANLYDMIGVSREITPTFDEWLNHVHPDFHAKVNQALDKHFSTRERFSLEYMGRNEHGDYGWFVTIGNSTFDEEGNPLIMSGSLRYIQDVMDIKDSEREKNSFLNAIYNGSEHAIWAVEVLPDDDFRFVEYNETAYKRSQTTPEMLLNKTLTELSGAVFPHETINRLKTNYSKCSHSGKTVVYSEQLEVDPNTWYQTSLYPVFNEQGKITHVIGTAVDITFQKATETQLERNKVFLERLINNAVCGLYIYDLERQINIQINDRYSEILGYSLEELQAVEDLPDLFHPEDIDCVVDHIAEVERSKEGDLIALEYRFKHKEGHWVWCYSMDSIISRDENGKPTQMLGTFIDVTERVALLDKLKESNNSLERFAFVASHDLQEPLRKISAFSDSLLNRLGETTLDDDSEFELGRLIDASNRMRSMINDLLALSRINSQRLNYQWVELQQLIKELCEDLSLLIEESGTDIELPAEPFDLWGDKGLLRQVFQNLIQNSIKFRRLDIKPKITFQIHYTDPHIELIYKDNGIGIEGDKVEKIFDPFYKLHSKEQYDGSGIGLAIVKQVIRVHNGDIYCDSKLGEGTTFVIKLSR